MDPMGVGHVVMGVARIALTVHATVVGHIHMEVAHVDTLVPLIVDMVMARVMGLILR